ncbi:SRPBCC family protein [Prauserella oleivorans]
MRAARACGPRRLEPGSRFAMDMRVGVPYRLTTTVVEYEQNRLIAWRHFFGHRWRWELDPDGDGRTAVTETFDWSTTRLPFLLDRTPLPTRNRAGIERTLERLAGTFGDTRPNGTRSAAPARRFRRRSRCPCRR